MSNPPLRLTPVLRRQLYNQLMRRSFGDFHSAAFGMMHGGQKIIGGPHVEAMAHALTMLATGEIRRLIITLPPRHGKSEICSASFPAWLVGRDPTTKVTIASYGQDLSGQLTEKARLILQNSGYQKIFPVTRIRQGRNRADHYTLTEGGSIRAASRAGAMTGHGTHYLIVDDWHKAGEVLSALERDNAIEQFKSTFQTRFDNLADSRILIVQQRLHEDDLAGWAISHGSWHLLNLPGIAVQDEQIPLSRGRVWHRRMGDVLAPALASREVFEELLLSMGPRDYEAQIQQNPGCVDGGVVDWSWFKGYEERPPRKYFHKVVQSVDVASSDSSDRSSWSVGQTWGYRDGEWWLIDQFRVREAFSLIVERVKNWHRKWRADVLLIERASNGVALYDLVRPELPGIIRAPKPNLGKAERLDAATVHLRKGNFRVPSSAEWLPDFRKELLSFPNGSSDDQVDALTQFVGFTFKSRGWVEEEYDSTGRKIRVNRRDKRRRFYDGDSPSATSW